MRNGKGVEPDVNPLLQTRKGESTV